MTDKMREEFEAHYAAEFAEVRGYKPSAEEMISMREGDGYGYDRGYLNGYWKGWQASRAKLEVSFDFDEWPTSIALDIRRAIEAAGLKVKPC